MINNNLYKIQIFIEPEMLNLITRSNEPIFIMLFNVDYNTTTEDMKNLYSPIQFDKINQTRKGVMILELNKKEASELVEIGTKVIYCFISINHITSILIKDHSS